MFTLRSLLWPIHLHFQNIAVISILLGPIHFNVQYIVVISILLWQIHLHVQHIVVTNTSSCSVYCCDQHIVVTNTSSHSVYFYIHTVQQTAQLLQEAYDLSIISVCRHVAWQVLRHNSCRCHIPKLPPHGSSCCPDCLNSLNYRHKTNNSPASILWLPTHYWHLDRTSAQHQSTSRLVNTSQIHDNFYERNWTAY